MEGQRGARTKINALIFQKAPRDPRLVLSSMVATEHWIYACPELRYRVKYEIPNVEDFI